VSVKANLQMNDYIVEDFKFSINQGFFESRRKKQREELSFSFSVKRKGSEPKFAIIMNIGINEKEATFIKSAYRLSLRIVGFFEFIKDVDEDTIQRMIVLNGSSILFGTARGIVAQITAHSPTGKVVLPSVNILEHLKKGKAVKIDKPSVKKSRKKKASN